MLPGLAAHAAAAQHPRRSIAARGVQSGGERAAGWWQCKPGVRRGLASKGARYIIAVLPTYQVAACVERGVQCKCL